MGRKSPKWLILALPCIALGLVSCFDDPVSPSNNKPPVDVTDWGNDQVDSLFNVLVQRVQQYDNVGSYDEFKSVDMVSLRNGFSSYLTKDATSTKANLGYAVSALFTLNTSAKVSKLIDTLESYYNDVNTYYEGGASEPMFKRSKIKKKASSTALLRTAFKSGGIQMLGPGLLLQTPTLLMAQTQTPTFPRFITLSYVQDVIEEEVLPVLNNVIAAFERLEQKSTMAVTINVEGDAYEIDLSDVYVLDAGLRLLRGSLYMYTTYDYNFYTSATDQTYSWIDEVNNVDSYSDSLVIKLSGDTLIRENYYGSSQDYALKIGRIYKYNFSRSGFLTIRNPNHAKAYQDFLKVPMLIKSGIASIRNENTSTSNEAIPFTMVAEYDNELLNFSDNLIDQGVSPKIANKFRTPETLMDFVKDILTGPVLFEGTDKGLPASLTVDISKYFTNPISDLKTFLPKYQWRNEADWISVKSIYSYVNYEWQPINYFYYQDYDNNVEINIPGSLIDSVDVQPWGSTRVTLKTTYRYTLNSDKEFTLSYFDLIDNSGNVIDINAEEQAKTFFPYFNDYTFNNIFPGMTRAKWLDLIY